MRRNDLVLGCAIVGAALLLFLAMKLFSGVAGSGDTSDRYVRVRVDGEVYGVWPLDMDVVVEVDLETGYNRLVIEDGEAWMEEADCPDGYCTRQGAISGGVESIICLPHKLVADIVEADGSTADDGEVDAIAK